MTNIRNFIQSHLLSPLKQYPTVMQDTMVEIITEKLEELYDYTWRFPEIVAPNQNRLDILKTIADQFLFTIREDADLQEQIDILSNILYIYNKRGSIDTIENMWKYYGGNLPKDVEVVIPSYEVFRYNISALSGTHRFISVKSNAILLNTPAPADIPRGSLATVVGSTREILITENINKGSISLSLANVSGLLIGDKLSINGIYEGTIQEVLRDNNTVVNSPGTYEIKLINNSYPLEDLKAFLINELVAAGNEIHFSNSIYLGNSDNPEDPEISIHPTHEYLDPSTGKYISVDYNILESTLLSIYLDAPLERSGMIWDGNSNNFLGLSDSKAIWSGEGSILLDIAIGRELDLTSYLTSEFINPGDGLLYYFDPAETDGFLIDILPNIYDAVYTKGVIREYTNVSIAPQLYCTPTDSSVLVVRDVYNSQGELITSNYPGYFILGETLLGKGIL